MKRNRTLVKKDFIKKNNNMPKIILGLIIILIFVVAYGEYYSNMQSEKLYNASIASIADRQKQEGEIEKGKVVEVDTKEVAVSKVVPEKVVKSPEQIKKEADAKIKADAEAEAKLVAIQKAKDDAAAKIIADKKIADAKLVATKKAAAAKAVVDAKNAEKVKYNAWVHAQFSSSDGSNRGLVDLVKNDLNDKASFEYNTTTYNDMGTYLNIKMTYKAKNASGDVIQENVTAKADYKTNSITITSQSN